MNNKSILPDELMKILVKMDNIYMEPDIDYLEITINTKNTDCPKNSIYKLDDNFEDNSFNLIIKHYDAESEYLFEFEHYSWFIEKISQLPECRVKNIETVKIGESWYNLIDDYLELYEYTDGITILPSKNDIYKFLKEYYVKKNINVPEEIVMLILSFC